jgi:inner membrane protein
MPTILSHTAVPLALGLGLGRRKVPRPLLVAGVLASMLPDADVIGFRLGVAYSDALGHRGATHSIAFALVLGLVALAFARHLRTSRRAAFLFVGFSACSHGLLDMLTNAGHGVEIFWPLTHERFFWPEPWRVVEAAPISLQRFASGRGLEVMRSELLWIWLPAAVVCGALLLARALAARRRGQ